MNVNHNVKLRSFIISPINTNSDILNYYYFYHGEVSYNFSLVYLSILRLA